MPRPVSPMLGAIAAWLLHLLGGYLIVTVWCQGGWGGMALALAGFTLVCLGAVGLAAVASFRLLPSGRSGEDGLSPRVESRPEVSPFLALLALVLSLLLGLLIVLQGLPAILAPRCPLG